MTNSSYLTPQTSNDWADFWRYKIGANVIPADTKNKKINVRWSEWQDKPIPESHHNKWKKDGAFEKGLAVMAAPLFIYILYQSTMKAMCVRILGPTCVELIMHSLPNRSPMASIPISIILVHTWLSSLP
jgi:hypothetical protein